MLPLYSCKHSHYKNSLILDFLDEVNNIIYELKPANPHGLRDGIKQLQRYNNALGGGFSMVLEIY